MWLPTLRPHEFAAMRAAGRAAADTLVAVGQLLRPGMATAEIDAFVRADTAARGGRPSQLGYRVGDGPAFPAAVCVSVNEVVCHGIPHKDRILQDGDIVNVDVTTELDGWHGDCSATFCIGSPSEEARWLTDLARRCRDAGVATVRPGGRLGDVGAAILDLAMSEGATVVSTFGGHGIGRRMHLPPHVPHAAPKGSGPLLRPGMAFTIEPMINAGGPAIRVLEDGWTVVTVDGRPSAQWEHTVLVTETGVEVLTEI